MELICGVFGLLKAFELGVRGGSLLIRSSLHPPERLPRAGTRATNKG
jgi:hypothetical protein